jgi:hypothetical protein
LAHWSGTTWLQGLLAEAAKAKPVFEPLHWSIDEYSEAIRSDFPLPSEDDLFVSSFMLYCRDELRNYPALAAYLRKALTGAVTHSWVRRGREGWPDAMRMRTVVKLVRGHLLIPAIYDTFSPFHIHIRRDPRAVVASIKRNDWGWWMQGLSLEDQLLRPEDGRLEYFGNWEEEIAIYDRGGLRPVPLHTGRLRRGLSRIVLFRSQEESLSHMRICVPGRKNTFPPNYPLSRFGTRRTNSRGCRQRQSDDGTEPEERLHGGKEELPSTEVERISSIAEKFGVSPVFQS